MQLIEIIEIINANDLGDFLTGGDPVEDIAQEWLDEDLTLAEIEGYIAARCFCAEAAGELKAAGISADEAAALTNAGIGGYTDTIGYKVANGDLDPSQL